MTCYQINEGDEPVALVNSLALAERIIGCQSPGFYHVEEIQVEGPALRWKLRKSRDRRSNASVSAEGEPHDLPDAPHGYYGVVTSLVTRKASRKSSKA